jgi:phospholipid transport system substrate-binding protein
MFKKILLLMLLAQSAWAQKADPKAIEKTVKTVITAVRFNKDDLAAKQLAFDSMTQRLMGKEWADLSDADKKELQVGVETLIRKISFKRGRSMFEHLDAVLYETPRIKDNEARIKSTVVVYRDYKKAEIVIDWVLIPQNNQWKIVDTILLGESTIDGIYEDEVKPLIAEGGIPKVMQALRKKLANIK